ncbi:putative methyltransferase [Gordonia namibiensis NBRC 108229]|uniref:Putative methyltransferase n=1 Tax=Gordonia namibiensis NBRC 108229 TaxID=1208314 RepID=K6WNG6_9ACTN|nr:methyltransferase domain-containing protein [Gordonia namibiensis]GAC00951.1 putative methyltransferase [Gordonia namibiensis NBRC 108229]
MTTIHPTPFDAEIKAKHRKLWAAGDYPAVADLIAPLGRRLVDALHIQTGEKVLDVAAGAGNVAVPAARAGGHVVATDLTPELLETGEARHKDLGITWRTADAEDLPFDEDDFDIATSCVGVMFAPNHQKCADELVRVVRPGGRIGLINWTPTGFIGELFGVMKPYAPPPPPGAQPGPLWGSTDHVRSLFDGCVTDHRFTTTTVRIDEFPDGAAFRDFFKAHYGPTIVTFRNIADDPTRVAALDTAIAELADRYITDGHMEWEYLQAVLTVV